MPKHRDLADLPFAPYLQPFTAQLVDEGVYDTVHVDQRVMAEVRAGGARFLESAFSATSFDGGRLRRARFNDVWLSGVRFVGTDLAESNWLDAEIIAGPWAGVELFGGELRRVRFVGCKLDSVNFRGASLDDVAFVDCLLRDVDFSGASMTGVSFAGTTLERVRLREAALSAVDLRGAKSIEIADGAESLRGATISSAQLIELAVYFAQALGVSVQDD